MWRALDHPIAAFFVLIAYVAVAILVALAAAAAVAVWLIVQAWRWCRR